jgi:nickel-dependent lactate racemase
MAKRGREKVEMMFGKGVLAVEIDADVTVIEKPPMPLIEDPAGAIQKAIDTPVCDEGASVPALSEYAKGKETACILICDITRPVPNGLNLPVLVRALLGAGVPASGITVLIATGLHRPNEGEELTELIGDKWVEETVSCVNHFARNDEDHTHVGTTSRGTVVKIDKRFVEADIRIATGLVEPHFMAGCENAWLSALLPASLSCRALQVCTLARSASSVHVDVCACACVCVRARVRACAVIVARGCVRRADSGGRKVIAPGIAHAETITTFHSARFMEDPKAIEGNLVGNPLHE